MKIQITEIHGLRDSIRSLYMSKRTWDWEKEKDIESVVKRCVNADGSLTPYAWGDVDFNDLVKRLLKWGQIHPTLLRFIDISAVVEGLHRGATDDFDSHARRLDNRIIRSSTRLATYGSEMSEWYMGKIIPLESVVGDTAPDEIEANGRKFVRTCGGYVREDLKDNKDVLRGLYTLAIPMNFTFKVNLPELGHIYRLRRKGSGAAPELQEMMESLMDQLEEWYPWFDRDYVLGIEQ